MKVFNYLDYLVYKRFKQRNEMALYDQYEEYHYEYEKIRKSKNENDDDIHQPHDKIIKTVLEQKKHVAMLINRVLNIENKIHEKDIEKYKTEYINFSFKRNESDVVYKMKEREIYFLIEHQSKIDYSMPKRILEYEVEIMSEALKGIKMTIEFHKLPKVIPIVVYTGNRKWNVEKYVEECQEKLTPEDKIKLGEYYVLDVNDFTNKELEEDEMFLSKIMLLEKLETEKEITQTLERILYYEKEEENINLLKRMIIFILKHKIGTQNREKLLKKMEKENPDMILEVIRKESEKQRREGKKEGKLEMLKHSIKNMLQFGEKEENIMKYMGINKEELESIKKSILKV